MANKKLSQLSQLTSATANDNDRLLAYVPGEVATVNQNKTISIGQLKAKLNAGNGFYFGTAAPTAGTYAQGNIVWNTTPTAGGFVGWVCVTAGSPGTWKTFGAISA